MKLSMNINYSGGFKEAAQRVVDLEKAGLDVVWIAEAYSFDAISQVGYLAAITYRVEIGTGILMIVTLGGLGIWVLIDLILILVGSFRDKEERIVYNW